MSSLMIWLLVATPAEEVQTVFDNIVGLGEVFRAVGLILMIYGVLGWAVYGGGSRSAQKGKQTFFVGVGFLLIGFDFDGFLQVIKYVLE